MWLLPIQKNEAIIYKTYNINSLSYTLLPLMVRKEHRQMLSFVVTNFIIFKTNRIFLPIYQAINSLRNIKIPMIAI